MIRISRAIPQNKIKLVIFDLDGTLIDSEHDLAASVNAMLVRYDRKELPLPVIGTTCLTPGERFAASMSALTSRPPCAGATSYTA